ITGLFDLNRRGGALWALAPEPSAAHIVGRSRDMSIMFFDDVIPLRLAANGLRPLAESSGYVGDLHANTIQAIVATPKLPAYPTSWLPTERTARAWLPM